MGLRDVCIMGSALLPLLVFLICYVWYVCLHSFIIIIINVMQGINIGAKVNNCL